MEARFRPLSGVLRQAQAAVLPNKSEGSRASFKRISGWRQQSVSVPNQDRGGGAAYQAYFRSG